MLTTIIAIFALADIIGMILLSYVLQTKETPKVLMVMHGLLAATALVLLIKYTFESYPKPLESAILFVIAALGGIILAIRDLAKQPVPKWLAVTHGLVAIAGFVFLLAFAF